MTRPDLRTTTAVIDTVLDAVSRPGVDPVTVSGIADCALSATEGACLSSHELLDEDEYLAVAL